MVIFRLWLLVGVLLIVLGAEVRAQDPRAISEPNTPIQGLRVRSKSWSDRTTAWPRHFYKDVAWWIGEFAIAGIQASDSYSTAYASARCPGCNERNPFLGPHPTTGRIIGVTIGSFALGTTLHALSWKACPDPNRRSHAWRGACNALVPTMDAAITIPAVLHNFSLVSRSPSTASSTGTMPLHNVGMVATGDKQTLTLPNQFVGCGRSRTFRGECLVTLRNVSAAVPTPPPIRFTMDGKIEQRQEKGGN